MSRKQDLPSRVNSSSVRITLQLLRSNVPMGTAPLTGSSPDGSIFGRRRGYNSRARLMDATGFALKGEIL